MTAGVDGCDHLARMILGVLTLVLIAAAPPPAPLAQRLVAPGGYETFGAERAVLIASGVETQSELDAAWKELDARLNTVVAALQQPAAAGSSLTREERLHRLMHVMVLEKFQGDLGDVRVTVRTGKYNCLTSTTLYVLAARRAGLAASAYGMRRHVVVLIFGAEGARYLEMTDPNARLMKQFLYPEGRYRQALRESPESAVQFRVRGARLSKLMATGEDADAVEVTPAPKTQQELEARARAEAALLRDSTFDADERGLAALLFWNRSIDFLVGQHPREGLECLTAMGRLGSGALLVKTRVFRLGVLDEELQDLGRQKGWPTAVEVLDHFRAEARDDAERTALVELRVALVEEFAAASSGTKACKAIEALTRGKPGDYTRALAWGC